MEDKMPIFAIPEHKETTCRITCPSLYTIVQFLCTLTTCGIMLTCMTSSLWVENFVVADENSPPYRILSVGLFEVCYYTNIRTPGTATDCSPVKFKDFTLSVQICQCIAAAAAFTALLLCLVGIINKVFSVACCVSKTCDEDKLSYETRKFRIVCYLVTILGLVVSIPLYMCEANLGGVELAHEAHHIDKRVNFATTAPTDDGVTTSKNSTGNFKTLIQNGSIPDQRIVEELTVTKKQSQMEGMSTTNRPHLPHYSVFGIALWMQFLVLATNVLTFTMALVKHSRKRKERLGEHSRQRILSRRPSLKPSVTFELGPARPRSESRMAFFDRQNSQSNLYPQDGPPMSP